jgi:hypothetical protein
MLFEFVLCFLRKYLEPHICNNNWIFGLCQATLKFLRPATTKKTAAAAAIWRGAAAAAAAAASSGSSNALR